MAEKFFGTEFVPAVGVVEDRKDPLCLGRCRVRWFGHNKADKVLEPTEQLPWSIPLRPLDNGQSVKPPTEGTYVFGYFLDGSEAQEPVMVGTFMGYPEVKADPDSGFFDPRSPGELSGHKVPDEPLLVVSTNSSAGIVKERPRKERFPRILNEPRTTRLERPNYPKPTIVDKTIVKFKKDQAKVNKVKAAWCPELAGRPGKITFKNQSGSDADKFAEPPTPYAAKYPYNHAYHSEGGHLFEIDDSPGAERVHTYHRSGSFDEFHTNGTRVQKTVYDGYKYVNNFSFEHTGKGKTETVGEGYRLKVNDNGVVGQNFILQVGQGGSLDLIVTKGSLNVYNMDGDANIVVNGSCNTYIEKDYNLRVGGNMNLAVNGNMIKTVDGFVSEVTKGSKTEVVRGTLKETFEGFATIAYTHDSSTGVLGEVVSGGSIGSVANVLLGEADVHINYSGNVEHKYNTNVTTDVASNCSTTVGGDFRHNLNTYNIVCRDNMKVHCTGTLAPGEFIPEDVSTGLFEVKANAVYSYAPYTYFTGRKFRLSMTRLITFLTTYDIFDLVPGTWEMIIEGDYFAYVNGELGFNTFSVASTTHKTESGLYVYE